MRYLLVLAGVNLFAFASPFLLIASVLWGTGDDQQFMKVAFLVCSPLTVFLWYCVLHVAVAGVRGFVEGYRRG